MSCIFSDCPLYCSCPAVNTDTPVTQCGFYTMRSLIPSHPCNIHLNLDDTIISSDVIFSRLLKEVKIRFDSAVKSYQKEDYKRLIELFDYIARGTSSFVGDTITDTTSLDSIIVPNAYPVNLPSPYTQFGNITNFSLLVLPLSDTKVLHVAFAIVNGQAKMWMREVTNSIPGTWIDKDAHLMSRLDVTATGNLIRAGLDGNAEDSSIKALSVQQSIIHFINRPQEGNGTTETFYRYNGNLVYIVLPVDTTRNFDPSTYNGLVSFYIGKVETQTGQPVASVNFGEEKLNFCIPLAASEGKPQSEWVDGVDYYTAQIYLSDHGNYPGNVRAKIKDVLGKQVMAWFSPNHTKSCVLVGVTESIELPKEKETTLLIDYNDGEYNDGYTIDSTTPYSISLYENGTLNTPLFILPFAPVDVTENKSYSVSIPSTSEGITVRKYTATDIYVDTVYGGQSEDVLLSMFYDFNSNTWTVLEITNQALEFQEIPTQEVTSGVYYADVCCDGDDIESIAIWLNFDSTREVQIFNLPGNIKTLDAQMLPFENGSFPLRKFVLFIKKSSENIPAGLYSLYLRLSNITNISYLWKKIAVIEEDKSPITSVIVLNKQTRDTNDNGVPLNAGRWNYISPSSFYDNLTNPYFAKESIVYELYATIDSENTSQHMKMRNTQYLHSFPTIYSFDWEIERTGTHIAYSKGYFGRLSISETHNNVFFDLQDGVDASALTEAEETSGIRITFSDTDPVFWAIGIDMTGKTYNYKIKIYNVQFIGR